MKIDWQGYNNFVPVRNFASQIVISRMWAGSFSNTPFLAVFEPGFHMRYEGSK